MVEEQDEERFQEDIFFATLAPGHAIVDSGATRTLVGEEVWKKWIEHCNEDLLGPLCAQAQKRSFKFGGGEMLESNYEVSFNALVKGQKLPITVSVVPGHTPFLLARPMLEQWGVKQDYKRKHESGSI